MVNCVILYMRIGLERGLNKITNKGERERASGENRVARVLGLYLGQLQKTIRLQLSLFTNYRNSYV